MSNRLLSRNHFLFIPINRRNVLIGMGVIGMSSCCFWACSPEGNPAQDDAIDRVREPLPGNPSEAMNELGQRIQARVTAAVPGERVAVAGSDRQALRVTNKEGGRIVSSSTSDNRALSVVVTNPDGLEAGVYANVLHDPSGGSYIEARYQRRKSGSNEPVEDAVVRWSQAGSSVSSPNTENGITIVDQGLATRVIAEMFGLANNLLEVQQGDPTPALPATVNLQ